MAEPLLQLLDAVRETTSSTTSPKVPDPIRDQFLPALGRATSLEEAERVLHRTTEDLGWLSSQLVDGPHPSQSRLREHFDQAILRLLESQDRLRDSIATEVGEPAAQQALLAQETFRRFLVEGRQQLRSAPGPVDRAVPSQDKPALEYVQSLARRLVLLVLAVERSVSHPSRGSILQGLASKAFDTSQLLRDLMGRLSIDLTPWLDVPDIRARRIADSASSFWGSMAPEEQQTVAKAWTEPMDLPARWP